MIKHSNDVVFVSVIFFHKK